MKTQVLRSDRSYDVSTWKLVAKLGLLAAFCMGLCYLFAAGVTSLASIF